MNHTDLIVIGGGPVGIFTAFYSGMRQMSVRIIDPLPELGGQLSALYPQKFIYDVAGFHEIKAQELVDNLVKQLSRFEATTTLSLSEGVENVVKNEDGTFTVTTTKDTYTAGSVIITAGNGAFKARPFGVSNEDEFTNIDYFVSNLEKFRDKEVVLFGGGDSAVDWALMLEPVAKKVTIVHRRNEFRAHEHSVELLKNSTVEILTPFKPVSLAGENGIASQIEVVNASDDSDVRTLSVESIVVNFGFTSNLGAIKTWGLELDKNAIKVSTTQATSVEGIFAAGDICTYEGKAKLIINGFGEAPVAVNSAKQYINPGEKLHELHSSSMF